MVVLRVTGCVGGALLSEGASCVEQRIEVCNLVDEKDLKTFRYNALLCSGPRVSRASISLFSSVHPGQFDFVSILYLPVFVILYQILQSTKYS